MIRDKSKKFKNLVKSVLKSLQYPLTIKIVNGSINDKIYYVLFMWANLSLAVVNYLAKKLKLDFRIKEILLDRDLIIENKTGTFYIRKLTNDYSIVPKYYEEKLKSYFDKTENGIFIDIGAHIGKYSIYMAKRLEGKGKVISIEPLLENYHSSLKNIELNKVKNITSLQIALSDKEKEGRIMIKDSINLGMSSLFMNDKQFSRNKNLQKVKVKSLDKVIEEQKIDVNEVKLLKIDVEGHELEVLNGSQNLLSRNPNLMIIFESFEQNIKQVEKLLEKYNFKIYKIDNCNYFASKTTNVL